MAVLGFTAYRIARDSMTETSIEFFVKRVAEDSASRINIKVRGDRDSTSLLANSGNLRDNVDALFSSVQGDLAYDAAESAIRRDLNNWVQILGTVDIVAVIDLDGRIVVTNNKARSTLSGPFAEVPQQLEASLWSGQEKSNPLQGKVMADRFWWPAARDGALTFIDFHREQHVLTSYAYPTFLDDKADMADRERLKNPEAYSYGYATGIPFPSDGSAPQPAGPGQHQAILVAFHNWSAVQAELDEVNEQFANHPRYSSAYTFMFRDDLDTIIGHFYLNNYELKLVDDFQLTELREAMLAEPSGVKRYNYLQVKVSGFAPVKDTGWRLGFGINESDFLTEVTRLRNLTILVGLLVTAAVIALIFFFAPRLVRPLKSLTQQADEIARGNLDARVQINSNDELEELGATFNTMAENLKESEKKLIKAQKTEAWQEMARQVAHEIKNPLTPIKLSAQLIHRAHSDQHPDFDQILETSLGNIVEQTESLRVIASEFSDFASFPKVDPKPLRILKIIESCVALYQNRGRDDGEQIDVSMEALASADVEVLVDAGEIKRVFLNLFNNAFEAMLDGGSLVVSALTIEDKERGSVVDIRFKDTGCGISKDTENRLFEPYFTTRNSGTGLGLAIAKKTVEGYGGTISIHSAVGEGTTVNITLPIHSS